MKPMRLVLQTISWVALLATIVPSLLFFVDKMGLTQMKLTMLLATVVWFVATPLWMGRDDEKRQEA